LGTLEWDWDSPNKGLDPDVKVEGTSSLYMIDNQLALCRRDEVLNVPHGAFETYYRAQIKDTTFELLFRAGNPIGDVSRANCYSATHRFHDTFRFSVTKRYAETSASIGSGVVKEIPLNTWVLLRFLWYVKDGTLYYQVKRFTTEWENWSDILFDKDPWFEGREIARVGFGMTSLGKIWLDSSRIYTIVP